MELRLQVKGVDGIRKRLGLVLSRSERKEMIKEMSGVVLENFKDHLDKMSPKRHKSAKRLGANPTHHLEYASGRTTISKQDENSFTITVEDTPGLLRAFGPTTSKPRRVKWLTIPIDKISYGKSVKDLRNEGHIIFRPGRAKILAEAIKKGKKNTLRPLYALSKETTSPRDRGLLPNRERIKSWSKEAAEAYFEMKSL